MFKVLKIAARSLMRFGRRTFLTSALITLGIVAVLLFVATTGSFKSIMIGQFTDSMLGHLEVHRKGYVASIDSLPLNLNMRPQTVNRVEQTLKGMDAVEAYAPRVKLGAMFSNFTETTSVRINGVDPAKEAATTPLLPGRLIGAKREGVLLTPGEILIPELIARGLKVKVGDTVVLVATNGDGSVNGKTFTVGGVVQSATGPGGKDGYISIEDARALLRMKEAEVSEFAIRLKEPAQLDKVYADLSRALGASVGKPTEPNDGVGGGSGSGPGLEVHTWADLSPFSSIVRMIDLLAIFIKVMLVSIVLISVMNVMMMAVYERIREIGTLSAIGTPPRRILSLFLTEGLLLGLGGTAIGTAISLVAIYALNIWKPAFRFGMQSAPVTLSPSVTVGDVGIIAALVIVMSALASLQPAWKASRMDPVTALGHV
ncbi:putative lipoprotein ABC transporter permease protein [Variovorax paradoxus B4]|uniref:Putative lipoprotein ABC transporter permease protein n=1 Tax=Variovorax paradoxus B4 TaxID=1246301 RepID=T1X9G6_VARPD|nr:ABC transporter permease [Variovorax paradoxus]AGU49106.1 putative lipoprotein ABC transporter permease protein [Variovorax paradoxus B4]